MHVFSLGRFYASPKPSPRGEGDELCSPDEVKRSRLPPAVPVSRQVPVPRHKPSPRGEDAELCSPDAVEASRPLRRRRSRAASCLISCFQSSMLLHNLSSVFFSRKESQPARPAQLPRPAPHDRHSAPSRKPAPRHSPASLPSAGPIPRRGRFSTDFPQTFHRVFHIFAGFPQWLSFPLAFLERNSIRSSESWVLPAA